MSETKTTQTPNLLARSAYAYDLPEELIAQTPAKQRDKCRLMVVSRDGTPPQDRLFSDITEYLSAGDCLVINDTRVIPARIFGSAQGHIGTVETVLLSRAGGEQGEVWQALTKPGKKTRVGQIIDYPEGLRGEVIGVLDDGVRLIRFSYTGVFMELLEKIGLMPLPPYIKKRLEDQSDYQTVYAKTNGSAAAPTAGLHFTPELLDALEQKGVEIVRVLLHVGLGTFRPVKEESILDHKMHEEYIRVTPEAAQRINRVRQNGGRVFAVGTTSVRTLESVSDESGTVHPFEGKTDIFLYPGKPFHAVDAIITNFHLPESTLLMLVSAFAGYETTMNAYRHAVQSRYRFFSFGDAMLLL